MDRIKIYILKRVGEKGPSMEKCTNEGRAIEVFKELLNRGTFDLMFTPLKNCPYEGEYNFYCFQGINLVNKFFAELPEETNW